MSFRDELGLRLNYRGGSKQQDRMIADKLWSLKSSINHSYQTVTIETPTEQRFRCLLNPDQLKMDYDCRILSIPYKAIDLNDTSRRKTSEGEVEVELKNGDVFTWVEDNSKWLLVLQYTNEVAYYRTKCKKCEAVAEVGDGYPVYVRGPVETTIDWYKSSNTSFNDLNYSLIIYITKNEETTEFFHRHKIVKIDGLPYEVQAIDWYGGDGIIEVCLDEYWSETIKEEAEKVEPIPEPQITTIQGEQEVDPYDTKTYTVENPVAGAEWKLSNNKARIIKQTPTFTTVEILTGKSGEIELSYIKNDKVIDKVTIIINSI